MAKVRVSVSHCSFVSFHDSNLSFVDQLQYLDRDDFKRYLDATGEKLDHLTHDVEHVKLFHGQHLGSDRTDKKRDTEYVP
jgi:hypothetical protein